MSAIVFKQDFRTSKHDAEVFRNRVESLAKYLGAQFGGSVGEYPIAPTYADRLSRAEDVLSGATSEVESLAEEMRSWFENLPENLQYSGKGEEIETAASTLEDLQAELEGIEWPDVPEFLDRDVDPEGNAIVRPTGYRVSAWISKKGLRVDSVRKRFTEEYPSAATDGLLVSRCETPSSRSERAEKADQDRDGAASLLLELIDDVREEIQNRTPVADVENGPSPDDIPDDETQKEIEALESFLESLEEIHQTIENASISDVEFPGMY